MTEPSSQQVYTELLKREKKDRDRFKVGDDIYLTNWYHGQPRNTVVKGKIVARLNDPWSAVFAKYAMILDGGKREFLIGDRSSPDFWGSRIYKNSIKEIYNPRKNDQ